MKIGYMPSQLMSVVIVPLVKCKTGDLSDVDNYRAITLSNSASKIIETLLFDIIETVDDIDDYQFGFQKGVSTVMCTDVFKSEFEHVKEWAADNKMIINISKTKELVSSVQV